jgi:uncharacterized membrane protein YadS
MYIFGETPFLEKQLRAASHVCNQMNIIHLGVQLNISHLGTIHVNSARWTTTYIKNFFFLNYILREKLVFNII